MIVLPGVLEDCGSSIGWVMVLVRKIALVILLSVRPKRDKHLSKRTLCPFTNKKKF